MKLEQLHPADQLVMIMNRIYYCGMTTTSGGNLSIKDENGDIWITPAGIDKGSLSASDIVQVKPDGTTLGRHKPSCELPFHQSTYNRRPDIKAVVHAHPPALVSFSIVRRVPDTRLIPNTAFISSAVGLAEYDIPGSSDLGDKIASVLKRGYNRVLLENHGVVVVGRDLSEAFMAFESLDFCARIEINALKIGTPSHPAPEDVEVGQTRQVNMEEYSLLRNGEDEEIRKEMCAFIGRSYNRMLITSAQGTFSVRLNEHSFLITPDEGDRKYLDADDMVRIDDGKREAGKIPDRMVLLHKAIYDKHPYVNSVITAQPPNMMAFAVTGEAFDSRTIPESYIILRQIKRLPFGSCQIKPAMVADAITKSNPIILVQNDCLLVTGSSLLNAFDRLEVAEYSAKALVVSKGLGELVVMNDEQIMAIEKAFHLD